MMRTHSVQNQLFYVVTVAIWGSTWLAIKFQLGSVDPMVSVAYRFSIASFLLLAYCSLAGRPMRFSAREHTGMALQGALLFALNYWLFYLSELHLTSGLVAVVFSTIVGMNMLNGAWILGSPLVVRVAFGAGLGFLGIGLVFWPEVSSFHVNDKNLHGLLLCFAATLLASLGNIASARNQRQGLPVVQSNAYGMGYGALTMWALSLLGGRPFSFEVSWAYVGSLAYLAVFGSIVAFGCYLTLLGRIGADRAAYATLLFPIVALGISTLFEGYRWTGLAFAGVALILAGNLLVLLKEPPFKRLARMAGSGVESTPPETLSP